MSWSRTGPVARHHALSGLSGGSVAVAAKRDYYEVLGIPKDSPKEDIRRAYRKLAKEFHPDTVRAKNPGRAEKELQAQVKNLEEKFKEISEAYEVLANDQKRAAYDRHGFEGAGFQSGGFDWSQFSHFRDISDIFGADADDFFGGSLFEQLFGRRAGGGRASHRTKGRDIRHDLEITLEESGTGKSTVIEIPRRTRCTDCGGSGAAPGTKPLVCPVCRGNGQVQETSRQGFAQFIRIGTCPRCRGQGQTIQDTCKRCSGTGRVLERKKLEVRIPAGAEDSTALRIPGAGEVGEHGGPAGDVYIVISIPQHPVFERDGMDLYADVEIPYPTAALGGEAPVPTLNGKVALRIPAGTASGTLFRLRGKGLPSLEDDGTGDEFVRVTVGVPKKMNAEQRAAVERLAEALADGKPGGKVPTVEGEESPQPKRRSWLPFGGARE